jgi:ubiquinone/menaquinone biosynthesis C-methylase UbiE
LEEPVVIKFRKHLAKTLYWYVSTVGNNAMTLMNYGYSASEVKVDLTPAEEANRYAIQLYHHVTSGVDLRGKDVIEIGCGRGGGLSYLARNMMPSTAVGVDMCKKAISFCNQNYRADDLSFVHANAERLPFDGESFDVAINVESSHRYENFEKFLREVHRVLRPGGVLLFADYRSRKKMASLRDLIGGPFQIIYEECINDQVVASLHGDWDRKFVYYKDILPGFMHRAFVGYSYKIRARLVKKFAEHEKIYFNYRLQKRPEQEGCGNSMAA